MSNIKLNDCSLTGKSSKTMLGSALILITGTVAYKIGVLLVTKSHILKFSDKRCSISLYFYSSISYECWTDRSTSENGVKSLVI